MAKPPLSMKPTGWFQVAWSDEIKVGDVHRMKYFDREMIAWRAQSGQLTVMDAYCEHLGAHLGYGGHVVGRGPAVPVPRMAVEPRGPQRLHPVSGSAEPRPPHPHVPGRRTQRVRVHLARRRRRDPYFDAPDIFASFADGSSAADYYPQQRLYRETLEMHPQYVLENGVDFAHFKFVHQTPIVPVFTRHDFDEPVSYVDFTITFEGDENQTIDDVKSGVEAINGGLGIAVTKSWGMVDNRTISAITPVDDRTSDVRFMVYIGRTTG